jgi:hypothetical protein
MTNEAQLKEVLDFLNSIAGDGYGGMASFEIAKAYVEDALRAQSDARVLTAQGEPVAWRRRMLYDPKWEVKADILTMESLIAWLEKQNPRKRYKFWDLSGKCLYGLYMASHGIIWRESGGSDLGGEERSKFCAFVYGRVAAAEPYTFGAALKRARAVKP